MTWLDDLYAAPFYSFPYSYLGLDQQAMMNQLERLVPCGWCGKNTDPINETCGYCKSSLWVFAEEEQ